MAVATVPAAARADRPTSGDLSILSGRTTGIGETALAAGIGYPGLWAAVCLAPSSTFNLALRGAVLYGPPVMGFREGIGGEISVPMRLHVHGEGEMDVSIAATPSFFIGPGALAGQNGTFKDDAGWGVQLQVGGLLGLQLTEATTFVAGASIAPGYVTTPDAEASDLVGTAVATIGLEALPSRDTLLFIVTESGYGLAPTDLFQTHFVFRLWVGLAYLL